MLKQMCANKQNTNQWEKSPLFAAMIFLLCFICDIKFENFMFFGF